MQLYVIKNKITGKLYVGMSINAKKRYYVHKYCQKHTKIKSPLYDAMRKYGFDAFELIILRTGLTKEEAARKETKLIARYKHRLYNLHAGGSTGYDMSQHPDKGKVVAWRQALTAGRKGKTPALGMKHTEATKALCGAYGKLRWDLYGRYPTEVLDMSFINAHKTYGISKTHYYRLKKSRGSTNETV